MYGFTLHQMPYYLLIWISFCREKFSLWETRLHIRIIWKTFSPAMFVERDLKYCWPKTRIPHENYPLFQLFSVTILGTFALLCLDLGLFNRTNFFCSNFDVFHNYLKSSLFRLGKWEKGKNSVSTQMVKCNSRVLHWPMIMTCMSPSSDN